MSDALLNGSASVREFFSSPNGKVFVVFESKVPLTNGGTECLIAEVDTTSGIPECIDESLDSVNWNLGNNAGYGNAPIQFSADGSIFFSGQVGSTQVLRRVSGGVVTDLINDNIRVVDFIVLGNGSVIVHGVTNSTQVYWLRRISTSGGLKNLFIGSVQQLARFADGYVYVGLWSNQDFGWKRYLPETDALEGKYWISGNTNGIDRDAYFSLSGQTKNVDFCEGDGLTLNYAFCGSYGTNASPLFNVLSASTFGVAGGISQERQLWQYYPVVTKTNVTAIRRINLAQQVISNILLAGTDQNGVNTLSVYDTSSKQETVVLDGSNEVEIYSMSYSQRSNSIMFSGLRFADNKFVIGEVSLG